MLRFHVMLHIEKERNKFNQYGVMCMCAEIITGKSEDTHLTMP